jgi:glycosyltransferase involved in cell wall biosynthesis
MRILLATVQAPFVSGGAEYLALSLKNQLGERGHQCDIAAIPFKWYPMQSLLQSMLACRLLRLECAEADLVIGLKFPAYLAPWKRKSIWLIHQFRQAYDLWGTQYQDLPDSPEGMAVRDAIITSDNTHLSEVRSLFTISQNVADRLRRFNQLEATEVLYPPLAPGCRFQPETAESYFFFPSRLVSSKRQALAIEAMRYVRGPFRLLIAGKAESVDYQQQLQRLIEQHDLGSRVKLLGWISEEEKTRLMNRCTAVVFPPFDEDYGFVTLEAFHAHKPVITVRDGGGATELVEHERSGLIVDADPHALAEAMDRLWREQRRTSDMGAEGFQSLGRRNISWDYVVERLTA